MVFVVGLVVKVKFWLVEKGFGFVVFFGVIWNFWFGYFDMVSVIVLMILVISFKIWFNINFGYSYFVIFKDWYLLFWGG